MIDNVQKGQSVTADKQNKIIDAINRLDVDQPNSNSFKAHPYRYQENPELFRINIQPGYFAKESALKTYFQNLLYIDLGKDSEKLKKCIKVSDTNVKKNLWIDSWMQNKDQVINNSFLNPSGKYDKGFIPVGDYSYFNESGLNEIFVDVFKGKDENGNLKGYYSAIYTDKVLAAGRPAYEERCKQLLTGDGVTEIGLMLSTVVMQSTPLKPMANSTTSTQARTPIQCHLGDINVFQEKVDTQMSAHLGYANWVNKYIGQSIDSKDISGMTYLQVHNFELSNNNISTTISVDSDNIAHLISTDISSDTWKEMKNLSFLMRNQDNIKHPELVYMDLSAIIGLSGGEKGDENVVPDKQKSIFTKELSSGEKYHQLHDFDSETVGVMQTMEDLDEMDIVVRHRYPGGLKTVEYKKLTMERINVITDLSVIQGDQSIQIFLRKRPVCIFDPEYSQDQFVKIADIEEDTVVTESTYNNRSHEFNNSWTRYAMIKPVNPESDTDLVFRATYHGAEHHDCLDYNS